MNSDWCRPSPSQIWVLIFIAMHPQLATTEIAMSLRNLFRLTTSLFPPLASPVPGSSSRRHAPLHFSEEPVESRVATQIEGAPLVASEFTATTTIFITLDAVCDFTFRCHRPCPLSETSDLVFDHCHTGSATMVTLALHIRLSLVQPACLNNLEGVTLSMLPLSRFSSPQVLTVVTHGVS